MELDWGELFPVKFPASVGWIDIKDKGGKMREAKAALDSQDGVKSMEVVNYHSKQFTVLGEASSLKYLETSGCVTWPVS